MHKFKVSSIESYSRRTSKTVVQCKKRALSFLFEEFKALFVSFPTPQSNIEKTLLILACTVDGRLAK